jgi:hypothetical protein
MKESIHTVEDICPQKARERTRGADTKVSKIVQREDSGQKGNYAAKKRPRRFMALDFSGPGVQPLS